MGNKSAVSGVIRAVTAQDGKLNRRWHYDAAVDSQESDDADRASTARPCVFPSGGDSRLRSGIETGLARMRFWSSSGAATDRKRREDFEPPAEIRN